MNKPISFIEVLILCIALFLGHCLGKVIIKRLNWDKNTVSSIEPIYPPDYFPGAIQFRANPTLR